MNFTKEFLIEEYINKNKTASQIAKEVGVCAGTIQYHINKNGISKDRATLIKKEFLEEEFVKNKKSVTQIAKELNRNTKTVCFYIKKYNLEKKTPSKILTRELMEELYIKQKLSTVDIAKILGIKSISSIKDAVRKYELFRDRIPTKLRRTWGGIGEISGRYLQSLRNRCKQYNIENDFTPEYLWDIFIKQNRKCPYSGIELKFAEIVNNEGIKEQTASLDRIDSSKGYIIGNLQWVHKDVNKMKQNFSDEYFKTMCIKIGKNLESVR